MSQSQYNRKRSRNPSPRHLSERYEQREPERKIRNVTSAADHDELQRHYQFVPSSSSSSKSTWQERMVNNYHSHLYKEYVLADMTRAPAMLGLRWRTRQEVEQGRGHATCGNKHCPGGSQIIEPTAATQEILSRYKNSSPPTSNQDEERLLQKVPHGIGLSDYEVPFTYTEQGESKTELVKLRLCLKCSPLLFKGGAFEARMARSKRRQDDVAEESSAINEDNQDDDDEDKEGQRDGRSDSDDESTHDKQRKRRRKHRRKQRKRRRHR